MILHFSPKKIQSSRKLLIKILNHDLIEGNLFCQSVTFSFAKNTRASLSYFTNMRFRYSKKRYLYNKSNDKRDYEKFIKNPMSTNKLKALYKLCKEYNYKIMILVYYR
jgi:uncharacterized Zn-finger protein